VIECEHCHHKHHVSRPAPPPPKQVVVHVRPEARHHHQPSGARMGLLIPFVIVPIAIAVYWMWGKGKFGSSSSAGGLGGEHLTWESNGGPPVPVQVDGKDHFLGRVRAVHADDQLFVVLVDAGDVHFRWRTPALGSYSDGYRSTWFAVAGAKVVVSDHKGAIHIYDLATGKEDKALAATDKIEAVCALEGNEVFVKVADGRHQIVDAAAGTLRDADQGAGRQCRDPSRRRDEGGGGAPRVEGFDAKSVHVEGAVAVAGGKKRPGTPLPEAVGFDPSTKQVLWHQPVAQVDRAQVRDVRETLDDLEGDRYVSVYGVGQDGWRVAAFDAKAGTRLWDVLLRPIFAVDSIDEVVATPTRVLVTRTSSLDVLDGKTGKLVGTVGTETYD
jgi:outer membrane protein assembly factor BamB